MQYCINSSAKILNVRNLILKNSYVLLIITAAEICTVNTQKQIWVSICVKRVEKFRLKIDFSNHNLIVHYTTPLPCNKTELIVIRWTDFTFRSTNVNHYVRSCPVTRQAQFNFDYYPWVILLFTITYRIWQLTRYRFAEMFPWTFTEMISYHMSRKRGRIRL